MVIIGHLKSLKKSDHLFLDSDVILSFLLCGGVDLLSFDIALFWRIKILIYILCLCQEKSL